jgi:hypothetical protein
MSTRTVPAPKTRSLFKLDRAHWPLGALDELHVAAACLTLLILGWLLARLPYPVSGSDGGNWLALSGGFMGISANAASTVYPPGFLILLVLVRAFAPPIEALRLAGALVALLPGIGCYLLLRSLRLQRMALVGMVFPLLGYSSEMIAWGGYPQLMGTGLTASGCAALVHGYRTNNGRSFAATGVLAGLAVMTHQLAGLQAILAVATASTIILLWQPRLWHVRLRQWALITLAFTIVVLPGVPVYIGLVTRAGLGSFNAQGFTNFSVMLDYLTYDAPGLWSVVGACVGLAVVLRGVRRAWIDVAAICGLAVASLGLAFVTFEVRALGLGLMLGVAATAMVFADLIRISTRRWALALAGTACALWVTLVVAGQQRLDVTTRYYSELDPYLVSGLQWLEQHARPGDLAVSMRSKDKWPLGWWVQGLGHVPSYLDYDPRWLYFKEEKEQSAIAQAILANTDPQRTAVDAQQYGVTLLIFDMRDGGQADVWLRSGRVYGPIGLVYSNPSLDIFRIDKPTIATLDRDESG